ncbi:MAG: mercuric reductase [Planctomycetia bacterium]|nr:mercuric reductase [Planctomycetia bacterium]
MSAQLIGEFDRELVAQVAPASWQPSQPTGRYNLVVLGAGPAGLVCAVGAAGLGAKVALVEKHRLGGDCLNYGCVPSKALLRCSKALGELRRAAEFGIKLSGPVEVDFPAVMERMRRLRAGIGHHDAAERFKNLGIDVYFGAPRFTAPDAVSIGGQTLHFARAVVATGARASLPPIPGLAEAGALTNETVFNLTELPRRLIVIGAGPIGCELAQCFQRFGSQVALVDIVLGVLPRDDPDAAAIVRRALEADGMQLHLGVKPTRAESDGHEKRLHLEVNGQPVTLTGDAILVAAGRRPNTEDLGLEAGGIQYDKNGIQVNDYLQTTNPNVYAAGDICSPFKFTHAADALARIVIRNALFFGRAKASSLVIPWATYTDPEVAQVGLTAREANEKGIAVQTFRVSLGELDRGILDGETEGFALAHVRQGKDEIIGATVVAAHAGDLIAEMALAMTKGLGLSALSQTIHSYPTQAEVWKKLGDAYMRTKLTGFTSGALKQLLQWRR